MPRRRTGAPEPRAARSCSLGAVQDRLEPRRRLPAAARDRRPLGGGNTDDTRSASLFAALAVSNWDSTPPGRCMGQARSTTWTCLLGDVGLMLESLRPMVRPALRNRRSGRLYRYEAGGRPGRSLGRPGVGVDRCRGAGSLARAVGARRGRQPAPVAQERWTQSTTAQSQESTSPPDVSATSSLPARPRVGRPATSSTSNGDAYEEATRVGAGLELGGVTTCQPLEPPPQGGAAVFRSEAQGCGN